MSKEEQGATGPAIDEAKGPSSEPKGPSDDAASEEAHVVSLDIDKEVSLPSHESDGKHTELNAVSMPAWNPDMRFSAGASNIRAQIREQQMKREKRHIHELEALRAVSLPSHETDGKPTELAAVSMPAWNPDMRVSAGVQTREQQKKENASQEIETLQVDDQETEPKPWTRKPINYQQKYVPPPLRENNNEGTDVYKSSWGSRIGKVEVTTPSNSEAARRNQQDVYKSSWGSRIGKVEVTTPSNSEAARRNQQDMYKSSWGSRVGKVEVTTPSNSEADRRNQQDMYKSSWGSRVGKVEVTTPSNSEAARRNQQDVYKSSWGSRAEKIEVTTPSNSEAARRNQQDVYKSSWGSRVVKIEVTTPSNPQAAQGNKKTEHESPPCIQGPEIELSSPQQSPLPAWTDKQTEHESPPCIQGPEIELSSPQQSPLPAWTDKQRVGRGRGRRVLVPAPDDLPMMKSGADTFLRPLSLEHRKTPPPPLPPLNIPQEIRPAAPLNSNSSSLSPSTRSSSSRLSASGSQWSYDGVAEHPTGGDVSRIGMQQYWQGVRTENYGYPAAGPVVRPDAYNWRSYDGVAEHPTAGDVSRIGMQQYWQGVRTDGNYCYPAAGPVVRPYAYNWRSYDGVAEHPTAGDVSRIGMQQYWQGVRTDGNYCYPAAGPVVRPYAYNWGMVPTSMQPSMYASQQIEQLPLRQYYSPPQLPLRQKNLPPQLPLRQKNLPPQLPLRQNNSPPQLPLRQYASLPQLPLYQYHSPPQQPMRQYTSPHPAEAYAPPWCARMPVPRKRQERAGAHSMSLGHYQTSRGRGRRPKTE